MEEKKLRFEVRAQGTLEKAVETPIGVLYIDIEHEVLYVESEEEEAYDKIYAITCLACIDEAKGAVVIKKMMENFAQLTKKQVKKDGENYSFDVEISGELEVAVSNKFGTLYTSPEHRTWYFEAKHPNTFLEKIEFEKFVENIFHDLADHDISLNALAILVVMQEWVKLNNEDIVK